MLVHALWALATVGGFPVPQDALETPWAPVPEDWICLDVRRTPPRDRMAHWVDVTQAAGFGGLVLRLGDEMVGEESAWIPEMEASCLERSLSLGLSFEHRPTEGDLGRWLAACRYLFLIDLPAAEAGGAAEDRLTALLRRESPAAILSGVPEPSLVYQGGLAPIEGVAPGSAAHVCRASLASLTPRVYADPPSVTQPLFQLHQQTVGRGAYLQLEVSLDETGGFHPGDEDRLRAYGVEREQVYAIDRTGGGVATASSSFEGNGGAPGNVLDHQWHTSWRPALGTERAFVEVALKEETVVDRVVLREALRTGEKVIHYQVYLRVHGLWREVGRGQGVGRCRIVTLAPSPATGVRVVVSCEGDDPALASLELYSAPPRVELDVHETVFMGSTQVRLTCSYPGVDLHYTLDGSAVGTASPRYSTPLVLSSSCTLRAAAVVKGEVCSRGVAQEFQHFTADTLWPAQNPTTLHQGLSSQLSPSGRLEWSGYLTVPEDGIYTFLLPVNTPLDVILDDQWALGHASGRAYEGARKSVGLKRGLHALRIQSPVQGSPLGTLAWRGPGLARQLVRPSDCSH